MQVRSGSEGSVPGEFGGGAEEWSEPAGDGEVRRRCKCVPKGSTSDAVGGYPDGSVGGWHDGDGAVFLLRAIGVPIE